MKKYRIEKLHTMMMDLGLDGVLLTKRESQFYFSCFDGTFAYLVITPQKNILITDSRYTQQATETAIGFEIVEIKKTATEELKNTLQALGLKRVGFESCALTYQQAMDFQKHFIAIEWVAMGRAIDTMRAIKDEEELAILKKAAIIADNAFEHVLKMIRPGVRENELAAELEYHMKKSGAQKPSFDTIVASGVRSALPHGVATLKKIEQGEGIVIDFGAMYENYCSDMTRTVFLGQPSEEHKKIYQIVKDAQEYAVENLAKGLTSKAVDAFARDAIQKQGYGKFFGHGLGHGVGLEIHEEPSLSFKSDSILEAGMVVTIEPGVYLPNMGGVRIEDMVIVGEKMNEVLTRTSKELIIL